MKTSGVAEFHLVVRWSKVVVVTVAVLMEVASAMSRELDFEAFE